MASGMINAISVRPTGEYDVIGANSEAKAHICMSRCRFGANHAIECTIRLACWSLHQETRWRRMRVEKTQEGWRVFVTAGGIPNGGATAADCTVIAVGATKGNTFQGEIKYSPDPSDAKPSPDNAVEPGHKITITFAPQFAEVTYAEVGCSEGTGIFGRYTRVRK